MREAPGVCISRGEAGTGSWELAAREPDARLRALVSPYTGWRETAPAAVRRTELPGSRIPLFLHLGPAYRVRGPSGEVQAAAGFVAGLHTAPARTETPAGGTECLQIDLAPPTAHRLLGVAMHELADGVVDVGALLGGEADALAGRLREAPGWEERFALVDAFLLRRLAAAGPPALEITWAWHALRRSGGGCSIGALARELGWSQRRLVAGFRREIGLPPKRVARLLRFERAVRLARSPARPTWAEVAHAAGYADQAHLVREFRDFAGAPPGQALAP